MTAEVAMHVPDLLIWAGRVITPGGVLRGAVRISGGRITAVQPYQEGAAARAAPRPAAATPPRPPPAAPPGPGRHGDAGRRRGAAAWPGRHARARERAWPDRLGGFRDGDAGGRGRRRDHDHRHAGG